MKNVVTFFAILYISFSVLANENNCVAVVTEGIDYTGIGGGITFSSPIKRFTEAVKEDLESKGYTIYSEAPQGVDYYKVEALSSVHTMNDTNEVLKFCFESVVITSSADIKSYNELVKKNPNSTISGYDGTKSASFSGKWSWWSGCSKVTRAVLNKIPKCGQIMN